MKDQSDDPSHHEQKLLPIEPAVWGGGSWGGAGGGVKMFYVLISTDGSGMPTTRPKTGYPV